MHRKHEVVSWSESEVIRCAQSTHRTYHKLDGSEELFTENAENEVKKKLLYAVMHSEDEYKIMSLSKARSIAQSTQSNEEDLV